MTERMRKSNTACLHGESTSDATRLPRVTGEAYGEWQPYWTARDRPVPDTIDAVSRSTREVTAQNKLGSDRTQPDESARDFEDLHSAPRRIRTFAPGSGGQCSIP